MGSTYQLICERFQQSPSTVSRYVHFFAWVSLCLTHCSRYIHHILNLLVGSFYSKYLHSPEDKTPEEIKSNPKLYPYF
ncbi:hypothetical protein L218DRAFT_887949 [Marasmius fiardii PR-910]|nr:hypothetical protein L218DRAFT_887949 [Marasmius fiardii PR-910]